jgi:polyhydroxyalkanoate synthesis regulator protein
MGSVLPDYLDASLESFQQHQERLQEQFPTTFGQPMKKFEEVTRQNMAVFERALGSFSPFSGEHPVTPTIADAPKSTEASGEDIDSLKRELDSMRDRLDKIEK